MWCKLCPRFKVGILAGMSAIIPLGMPVDMPPVMLPDTLGVRLFGMLLIKSKGKFVPATKYKVLQKKSEL